MALFFLTSFYAYDVVFFSEWTHLNAKNLCRLLRYFYLALGLKVNLVKCSLFGDGGDYDLGEMTSIIHCRVGSFPFNYLGLLVGANRSWKPIVNNFKSRLAIWKAKQLSFGGKITLIKSILNSLPTYFFSLYKAPVQVIEDPERLKGSFLRWIERCLKSEMGHVGEDHCSYGIWGFGFWFASRHKFGVALQVVVEI
ncbi:uncharacterized protein LOC110881144 [Helianthus annuus]|uniref:uncharacterized protein LOC110881144 n=1 Tax=Helianthus annuus TaxID=4232 RepID=UPI000B902F94|nr:uncharacterized protein LOC110881144 [Helianthus annuus]